MSRIIIKNLPKDITEAKLRKIFAKQGNITDLQLKYTPEGKFRQFAFIGYQNEDEAKQAMDYFNNTFIQTKKIQIEICSTLGDADKPKSKKLLEENQIDRKDDKECKQSDKTTIDKKKELLEKYKDDPLFEEFLQVHKPDEAQLLNELKRRDAIEDDSDTLENSEEVDDVKEKIMSDKDYMEMLKSKASKKLEQKPKEKKNIKLFTLKLRNLPIKCKKKDIKQFFSPNTPFSIRVPRNIKGVAYVGFKTEKMFKKGLSKHKSIMDGKSILISVYDKTSEATQQQDPKKQIWKNQEEKLKEEESIGESGRIFFRNLAYTTTEDDMEKLFTKYGPVTEVVLPIDKNTRQSKGFGVVTFLMPEHALRAYSELDGTIFQGRMLHLLPGITKPENDEINEESTNYKQKKLKKQKSQATSSHNWNSLFLSQDAVADVIANTFGTSKETVLDPHGDSNPAVRLALGETQIVASTRKYLEQQGVLLDAFNEPNVKRSKTIILVKNLPANTEIKEIRNLFEPFGIIGRIILPPSGITAIVEFVEPSEARKAFTKLAYTKFKHVPLYLEWAPDKSLGDRPLQTQKDVKSSSDDISKKNNPNNTNDNLSNTQNTEEKEEDLTPESDTTLFVKNLNFKTTEEDLRKHFEACGKVFSVTIATKKDREQKISLSMGYGFVRYLCKASAEKALKELQSSTLDGKSLELKRSERTLKNDVVVNKKTSQKNKQTGTKIIVRNVPFQATRKELFELFKAFGELKAVRLPKKMTLGESSHRGFAFIDYVTDSDAKKAFEALSQSTHLYGRRLVLEWAAAEQGVEEIRKRTANDFHASDDAPRNKKSVFNSI